MPSNSYRYILVAVLFGILFFYGLMKLFLIRFEAGDVYPAYSSLRSDPLGTQVLYESLHQLEPERVSRNYQRYDRVSPADMDTLLFCGVSSSARWLFRGKTMQSFFDRSAASGSRVVVSFSASSKRDAIEDDEEEDASECPQSDGAESEDANATDGNATGEEKKDSIDLQEEKRWDGYEALGFDMERAVGEEDETIARLADRKMSKTLPLAVPWRGSLYFTTNDDAWKTVYTRAGKPVIIERAFGDGTLVLAADSYLFSNEAMRRDRFSNLLAWLLVPGRTLIVDEFHHGLAKQPGVANLLRQYRLDGVLLAVLIIVLLIVWKHAVTFAPKPVDTGKGNEPQEATVGRDTMEGVVNLMRRHIPPEKVVPVSHDIWRSSALVTKIPDERLARAQETIDYYTQNPKEQQAVAVYRKLCRLLQQGKTL